MPKYKKKKKTKKHRHDPLFKQIRESQNPGILTRKFKNRSNPTPMETSDDNLVDADLSKKILEQARLQREEIEGKGERQSAPEFRFTTSTGDEEETEDLEAFPEIDDADSVIEEIEINEEDERALEMFMPTSSGRVIDLADLIMQKIKEKEQQMQPQQEEKLPEKVVQVYTDVGKYLQNYKSGKIPKAFKIVPLLKNWEDILLLTKPENWTPNAVMVATKLFASNSNPKMAQRFYRAVLLERIRDDIGQHKRLNYHLYQALKKSLFKPASFFKGILLPLAEEDCTAREAVIMSSVLAKMSIPVVHSAVALLLLTQMPYSGPRTLFIKTLLNKRYGLPSDTYHAVITYFRQFEVDERKMPVIWHQCFLMFVQRYKKGLTPEQKNSLKGVLKSHYHHKITDEIRRELFTVTPTIDVTMKE